MARNVLPRLALVILLALPASAMAQEVTPSHSEPLSTTSGDAVDTPRSDAAAAAATDSDAATQAILDKSLIERLWGALSQEEDPVGPINTDRPTFTPANTVVPRGRVQFESGFTFDLQQTSKSTTTSYDLPELATRIGIANGVEFRTYWFGQTWAQTQPHPGGRATQLNGLGDMEVGFKWQLLLGDENRKWLPTTALITSIYAPTGGTSPYSSETVAPYINLIYGWTPTEKLTISGSTGYLGSRQHFAPRRRGAFERYHQSLVAFYSVAERTTLFYEYYVLMPTESHAANYMDGGMLYRLTTNMQLDLRVGVGLNGNPSELFTGAGFSVRF